MCIVLASLETVKELNLSIDELWKALLISFHFKDKKILKHSYQDNFLSEKFSLTKEKR